jgi:carbonic anhydrase/acetyltransferase-like protein (isoleucine patch superfamily)
MPRPTRRRVSAGLISVILAVLGLAAAVTVPSLVPKAEAAVKTLYIPSRWQSTGEVPWVPERTRESNNFILLWGDLSGTNPVNAPSQYRFDPSNILSQLENLYGFYVNTMQFTPETGLLAQHKIIVIVTRTWSTRPQLDAWATGGSVDGRVGVINIAPAAAAPGSWGLAHELGHVFQNYTFLGRSGFGFTHASAGTFWEASAEYMAMQVYPNGGAGDLTRFLATENLYYSSSRHHYGAWMLIQYLVDRNGGIGIFNRIWNEARNTEHPLETYRRIAGLSQTQLNAQMAEYAQHQVTYDYSNRASFMPFINSVYGGGFLNAYNDVPVDVVNAATGHYKIADPMAPSDYGYNKIKLVPSSDGALIRLHIRAHVNSAASSGISYGFVAVRNGTPRYGPVFTAPDAEIAFQTQAGEREVYLVVVGAPTVIHKYAFLDGYPRNYRYPYEFRVAGAIPSGYEPGYVKPTPSGGRWHSNGGGWVDNRANVSASAYVGPRAAVYGNSTVRDNARIEGLAWVNSGATVGGNAIVRDNAIVQGGANLGGNLVLAGDAEMGIACSAGTYRMFTTNRNCDGGAGEADVNPAHGTFTDEELAITGVTQPPTTTTRPPVTTTTRPPVTTTSRPPVTTTTRPPVTTTSRPPVTGGGRTCAATYRIVNTWQGGFQGEVGVTAGATPIAGWTVTWTYANGQTITQTWGAVLTSSGAAVTARNETWNGALGAGAGTTFGFLANSGAANAVPAPTCTAT